MFLWERYANSPKGSLPEGSVLPDLRRGAGQEPGSVPAMWKHYSRLDDHGRLTRELWAEHLCLVAFGIHQQGKPRLVHSETGASLGEALRLLRAANTYSEEALDRRVLQLATADQTEEIATHLLSLIRMLRGCPAVGELNYTSLFHDLVGLRYEDRAPRVRRRWGSAYHRKSKSPNTQKEA